jgi:hypothetical protein
MKLDYAPQAGLRRRKPDHRREVMAFWLGIAILIAFELVLMAKSWSPESTQSIFAFQPEQANDEDSAAS